MLKKLLANILTGPLVGLVQSLGLAWINKEISDAEMKTQLSLGVLNVVSEQLDKNASIIDTEAKSEKFLQWAWRPMTALSFAFAFLFYVLIEPILVSWFGFPRIIVAPTLIASAENIVLVCLGGYMGLRTLEKVSSMVMTWWMK